VSIKPGQFHHAFHDEEGDDGRDTAFNRKVSSTRKLSFDGNDLVVFKDQIAASGFASTRILNNLGAVGGACASVLSGQEIDFDGNWVAV
jgi:hypothetical protein